MLQRLAGDHLRHLQHEAVLRVEHQLVARLQPAIAYRIAVDLGLRIAEPAQQHALAMPLQARMAFGEGRIVDADVAVAQAADAAHPVQGIAAAMVLAADPAQHQPRIVALAFGRIGQALQRLARALHHHFHAIGIDRVAGAQQRHAPHRTAIHVDAAGAVGHLQP